MDIVGLFLRVGCFLLVRIRISTISLSTQVAASVRLHFWMRQRSPLESLYAADNSISCKQIWRMTFSHKFKGVGHHHLHHHSDWMVEADVLLYSCTEEPAALLPRWVRERAYAVCGVCVVQLTCSAASAWCVVASRRTYSSSVVEDSFNHQPTFKIVQSNTQQFLINQSIHHSINQPINIHDWLRN